MTIERIDNKEAKNEISFDRLGTGEFFEYKKRPYIKINSVDAYCFTDDTIYCFYWRSADELVIPISDNNCKFIYEV